MFSYLSNKICYKEYLMIIRELRKKTGIFLLIILLGSLFQTGGVAEDQIPVNFKTLRGSWNLLYGNNYGYSFRFYENYRAIVILYLNDNSIIFKGVYNIESSDSIRINISEMKRAQSVKNLDLKGGFGKPKESHFIFNTHITTSGGKRYLELKRQTILIEGNDSIGFFEPDIKLDYSGK